MDDSKPVWIKRLRLPFVWNTKVPPLWDEFRLLSQELNIGRFDAGLPTNSMLLSGVNVEKDTEPSEDGSTKVSFFNEFFTFISFSQIHIIYGYFLVFKKWYQLLDLICPLGQC